MTSEFKIDKSDACKSFIPNAALAQDCIVCENSMPAGILYNDFGNDNLSVYIYYTSDNKLCWISS